MTTPAPKKKRRPRMKTYRAAVNEFLDASPWLGPEDAPAVAMLQNLAKEIDVDGGAALVAQFGLTYRNLLKRSPEAAEAVDPVDQILDEARG